MSIGTCFVGYGDGEANVGKGPAFSLYVDNDDFYIVRFTLFICHCF